MVSDGAMAVAVESVDDDILQKLKWLMLARAFFTALLLASTFYCTLSRGRAFLSSSFHVLYGLIVVIFILTFVYAAAFRRVRRKALFTYFQLVVDTFIVTMIIYLTGGSISFFSFLYLVVIIYAAMILFMRGGMVMAASSSIQYAILLWLEANGYLIPASGYGGDGIAMAYTGGRMLFKIALTTAGCFAVAFLSGLLTEQNRKTRKELQAMESHIKRVEKMAFMGEMAAGLAHEIKNPLASLSGSIQLLREELRYDPDQQRLMDIVLRETDRLSNLVNSFLFFARPPAGKLEVFNLSDALNEVASLFRQDSCYNERIELRTDITPFLWVRMDPTHLRQVIWNLLMNAAEAIEESGMITLAAVPVKGEKIKVIITDTGCGISPEALPLIFDPFYTTKPEGTGLGLSIVHRILETYGSRLDVETTPGKGTSLSFMLIHAEAPPASSQQSGS